MTELVVEQDDRIHKIHMIVKASVALAVYTHGSDRQTFVPTVSPRVESGDS